MERRRVVITGMGLVCPVGSSVKEGWQNARDGVTGIGNIERFDTSGLEIHFGGEVKNFDPKALFGHRETRRMDRVTQFAMAAAREAITDSGLNMQNEDSYEVGCLIGAGICGAQGENDPMAVRPIKKHGPPTPLPASPVPAPHPPLPR